MISLLRKIRKSFINSGSAQRYTFYALGEIVLVVVGILIALQINNWNDYRKARIKEKKVLTETLRTLKTNQNFLIDEIEDLERFNHSVDTLVEIIENRRPYSPKLNIHFHYARNNTLLVLEKSGYEQLKNIGMEILISDTLKNSIVNVFENSYRYTEKIIEVVETDKEDFEIYMRTHFMPERRGVSPVNYNFILNDHYYLATIKHLRGIRGFHQSRMYRSLENTEEVITLIENELSSRWK